MQEIKTQVGGTHYKEKSIQPWDAMEAWMTKEAYQGFLQGNAIKYLARWKDKGGVEDLRKAQHYIQKLIESETKPEAEHNPKHQDMLTRVRLCACPEAEHNPKHQDQYQETENYYHYVGV